MNHFDRIVLTMHMIFKFSFILVYCFQVWLASRPTINIYPYLYLWQIFYLWKWRTQILVCRTWLRHQLNRLRVFHLQLRKLRFFGTINTLKNWQLVKNKGKKPKQKILFLTICYMPYFVSRPPNAECTNIFHISSPF